MPTVLMASAYDRKVNPGKGRAKGKIRRSASDQNDSDRGGGCAVPQHVGNAIDVQNKKRRHKQSAQGGAHHDVKHCVLK